MVNFEGFLIYLKGTIRQYIKYTWCVYLPDSPIAIAIAIFVSCLSGPFPFSPPLSPPHRAPSGYRLNIHDPGGNLAGKPASMVQSQNHLGCSLHGQRHRVEEKGWQAILTTTLLADFSVCEKFSQIEGNGPKFLVTK